MRTYCHNVIPPIRDPVDSDPCYQLEVVGLPAGTDGLIPTPLGYGCRNFDRFLEPGLLAEVKLLKLRNVRTPVILTLTSA